MKKLKKYGMPMSYKIGVKKTHLLGLSIGLFVFFFAGIFSRLNVDVYHQGIIYSAAIRLLEGHAFYTGSFTYGPLLPVVNGLGLLMFGKHLVVIQLMAAACYGGISILLWRIWARFLPEWLSGVLVLCSFLLAPFLFWELLPWSSVYSLLFLLASLYLTIKWLETSNLDLLYFVGLFTALSFWTRQSVGIFLSVMLLFLVIVLPLFLHKNISFKRKSLYIYLFSLSAPILLGLLILFGTNSLGLWFEACFTSRLDWALNLSGNPTVFHLAKIVLFAIFDNFKPTLWMLLPLTMLFLAFEVVVRVIGGRVTEKSEIAILFTYLSICFVSLLQYYPVPDPRHYFWSALPLFALPVIFLRRMLSLKTSDKIGINIVFLIKYPLKFFGGCVLMAFLVSYYGEIEKNLVTGADLDASIRLIPAWERLKTFDTPFSKPPVLQGMMGAEPQVVSLNRLHDAITLHFKKNPQSGFVCDSGWDRMCKFYSGEGGFPLISKTGSLILSGKPIDSLRDSTLLMHESFAPGFAYGESFPFSYYLYAPIDYRGSGVKAEYKVIAPDASLVSGLENFPSNSNLAVVEITLNTPGTLSAIDISARDKVRGWPYNNGMWTTRRNENWWGIGIADSSQLGKINNKGARTNALGIKVSNELTLLLPLGAGPYVCDEYLIDMWFEDERRVVASANCK